MEAVFLFFLPAWCFIVVDTFSNAGNPIYDFVMSGRGKALLALAQLAFCFVLLSFFFSELETRSTERKLQ
jgi:hypothetical protein